MAENGWNGWKWLDMAGNSWKWLEIAGMAGNYWNFFKSLEIAEIGWNGWKLFEMAIMAGYCCKWLEWLNMAIQLNV